jgi:hypothetical protein
LQGFLVAKVVSVSFNSPVVKRCSYSNQVWYYYVTGAPIWISKPHFLDVDKAILDTVTVKGLDPQIEKHDTFADFEPVPIQ